MTAYIYTTAIQLQTASQSHKQHWVRLCISLLLALVSTVWLYPLSASADEPTFVIRRNFGTGYDNTRSIVGGDVDGDGDLDLITGNDDQENVVYLNDGNGNFYSGPVDCKSTVTTHAAYRCFGTGDDATQSVAVGDVNGDGYLDIVTGNNGQQNVVYLNDGTGNFDSGPVDCTAALTTQATHRCFGKSTDATRSVVLGDVNGDGYLDLIKGNAEQQSVIYLNDGKGHFDSSGSVRPFGMDNDNTQSVAVGDVNSDGHLDLIIGVIGNKRPLTNKGKTQSVVYLNDGAGHFNWPGGTRPFRTNHHYTYSVAVGDVNSDGHLDIITGNEQQPNLIYMNDGAGNFDWRDDTHSFGTGHDNTISVVAVDVNGDGYLDIITGDYEKQNAVYLNDGARHFEREDSTRPFGTVGDFTQSVAVGDVDRDGDLDLITGNLGQSVLYLNDGVGHFDWPQSAHPFGTSYGTTTSVAVGDVDRDGYLDVITGNEQQQNVLYLNDGAGNFNWPGSAQPFGKIADRIARVAVGDVNGDKIADRIARVAVGDVNGDGYLDIITGNAGQQNVVYLNNGTGYFGWSDSERPFGTDTENTFSVAVGDVDRDGDLDIITGNYGQQSMVYLNDGAGNFDSERRIGKGGPMTTWSVTVGDMNGDGYLDIITGNYGQQSMVYLNDGAGNFDSEAVDCTAALTTHATYSCFGTGNNATWSVAVGDVNSDGHLDIITGNAGQQNVVYLNDGAGNFGSPSSAHRFGISYDTTWSVAVGDVDGDRYPDIITGNVEQNAVYLNNGKGDFDSELLDCKTLPLHALYRCFGTDHNATWSVVLGDVNGDGYLDLITGNYGTNVVYLNDGAGHFNWPDGAQPLNPDGPHAARNVVAGDMDGDGYLDIIIGNYQIRSAVYLNDGKGHFDGQDSERPFPIGSPATLSVAVGDINGDGYLDIITGNYGQQNEVYLNDGTGHFDWSGSERPFGTGNDNTQSVAVGDVNGDGYLDIITGNYGQQNVVYLNDGIGHFDWLGSERPFGTGGSATKSVAVGDVDGDGYLDIIIGNHGEQSVLYLNDGTGRFGTPGRLFGTGNNNTLSVAVGDVNSDGHIDIITGNYGQQNVVYLNSLWETPRLPDYTPLIAVTRPLTTGNAGFFSSPTLLTRPTIPITYTLFNPNGGTVGQVAAFYSLNGGGQWSPAWATTATITQNLTTGQWLVGANLITQTIPAQTNVPLTTALFITTSAPIDQLDVWLVLTHTNNANLTIALQSPAGVSVPLIATGQVSGQNFQGTRFSNLGTTTILSATAPYTGTYRPAGDLTLFKREQSNGPWTLVITNTGTVTGTLVAWGLRLKTPPAVHVFHWDTFASGFFGQSDNVVVRLVAYAQPITTTKPLTGTYRYTNSTASVSPWPYASATTFPFSVRGTQVRVITETTSITSVAHALVYRLPFTATRGAQPFGNLGMLFQTDPQGYLQGHGRINISDTVVALLPAATAAPTLTAIYSNSVRLYYTSARSEITEKTASSVRIPGVQTLTVTTQSPLLLFDLKVALEWDARNDPTYQGKLRANLLRTSEIIYDWTNGQAALGNITVYQDRQHWQDANIRIQVNSRLRPNSDQGGIVTEPLTETVTVTRSSGVITDVLLTYIPGHVRMPVVWNRFGDAASGDLGEDWPRTLAHELGHYLFFLHDNYLGFDENEQLIPINGCPGAMSDQYRASVTYDEFEPPVNWPPPPCTKSLSNQMAGRSDWDTIKKHYPWLITPTAMITDTHYPTGPNVLPLAVTQVTFPDDVHETPSTASTAPFFNLVDETGQAYYPSNQARAFLFSELDRTQAQRLVDLGQPMGNVIKAWGIKPEERLCIFDLEQQHTGCTSGANTDNQLTLKTTVGLKQNPLWGPDIRITPITSRTIQISVTVGLTPTIPKLMARLYSVETDAPITNTIQLTKTNINTVTGVFSGTFHVSPTVEAYIHLWVEADPAAFIRETVIDYAIGGSPSKRRGRWWASYSTAERHYSYRFFRWRFWAPVLSRDGHATLLGKDFETFAPGEFYAFQTTAFLPEPPPWATVVGQSYRLIKSANAPAMKNASLSLTYLRGDVPPGEEQWLTLYFYDEAHKAECEQAGKSCWIPLQVTRQLTSSTVVAPVSEPGLYALMSSTELTLTNRGWNLIGYPIHGSRPVSEALASLEDKYTVVFGYDAKDQMDPWKVFMRDLPSARNDLTALTFGQGYLIQTTITTPITLRLRADSAITSTEYANGSGTGELSINLLLHPLPAVYYGTIEYEANADAQTPSPTLIAAMNGHPCAEGKTWWEEDSLSYLIKIPAADDQHRNCGAAGQVITFAVNGEVMAPTPIWQTSQVAELTLTRVTVYEVQPGDTLSSIAKQFGTTVKALMKANHIYQPDIISSGRELIIPR